MASNYSPTDSEVVISGFADFMGETLATQAPVALGNSGAIRWQRLMRARSYLILSDWLIIVATFGIALQLRRYQADVGVGNLQDSPQLFAGVLAVGIYVIPILGFWSSLGLYQRRIWLSRYAHGVQIAKGATGLVLGYLLLHALTKTGLLFPSRLLALYWCILLITVLCAHRLVVFPRLLQIGSKVGLERRVILIGDSGVSNHFLTRLGAENPYSIRPVGILSDKTGPLTSRNIPNLGNISDLPQVVEDHDIAGAIITDPDLTIDALMRLIEECIALFGWVDVHSARSSVWYHDQLAPDAYFDIPFVRLKATRQRSLALFYKRCFDLTVASVGLIALSPLVISIALLIKISSPGPILFSRERVGTKGQPFKFHKFRSMYVGAENDHTRAEAVLKFMQDANDSSEKLVNEQMVTPIGRIIRKLALDEVPQLWNVVKGDMSLVGPRPLTRSEYDAQEEWQKRRFDIKPGCASLWKVMAVRHKGVSFANASLYDIFYARNMSPLLDLQILVQTALIVLRARADG